MNILQSALTSQRFNRRLPWIAGAVLSPGLIAFLVAYLGDSGDTRESFGPGKVQTFSAQRNVALAPEARNGAAKFVRTAVLRQNLDQAWALSTPNARKVLQAHRRPTP